MKYHLIILHICERLFDELVKEWLKERYTIVSERECLSAVLYAHFHYMTKIPPLASLGRNDRKLCSE